MSKKSLIISSLAIIYVLSPLDIIPDWLPYIGALDDVALLTLAIPFIMKEVDKFLAWEEEQKKKSNSTGIVDAQIVD